MMFLSHFSMYVSEWCFYHIFWYIQWSIVSFILSDNLYLSHLSIFILFISIILLLKRSNVGLITAYLLSFFTMITLKGALFLYKNTGWLLLSIISNLTCLLSCSNWYKSLFSLNLISIYGQRLLFNCDILPWLFLCCNNIDKVV